MLMAIHNVPRVFLDDDIQDATCSNIHISHEEAKNCILCYLGNKYSNMRHKNWMYKSIDLYLILPLIFFKNHFTLLFQY